MDRSFVRQSGVALTGLFFLFCSCVLQAGLSFETDEISIHEASGVQEVVAQYIFSNTASVPVTVLSSRTSCDCASVSVSPKQIDPGKDGKVEVKFTIGDRQGKQSITTTLVTNAKSSPVHTLKLEIELPQFLLVEPVAAFWKRGEPALPVKLSLSTPQATPQPGSVKILRASEGLSIDLRGPDRNGSYEVVVAPESADSYLRGRFLIEAVFPEHGKKTVECFAYVK